MPFYLFQGSYTPAAIKAMVDMPQDRATAARGLVEAAGGTLHHIFFAFGKEDVVALAEMPDDESMAAAALAIGASGAFSSGQTTKLIETAVAEKAMGRAQGVLKSYTPPTG